MTYETCQTCSHTLLWNSGRLLCPHRGCTNQAEPGFLGVGAADTPQSPHPPPRKIGGVTSR